MCTPFPAPLCRSRVVLVTETLLPLRSAASQVAFSIRSSSSCERSSPLRRAIAEAPALHQEGRSTWESVARYFRTSHGFPSGGAPGAHRHCCCTGVGYGPRHPGDQYRLLGGSGPLRNAHDVGHSRVDPGWPHKRPGIQLILIEAHDSRGDMHSVGV